MSERDNSTVVVKGKRTPCGWGMMLGVGALTLVSGCLKPGGSGWGKQQAARDPDPNFSIPSSYEPYAPSSEDPTTYRPAPKADSNEAIAERGADGAEDPVNAYLARLNAATVQADEPSPRANEVSNRQRKRPNELPWRGNRPKEPIQLERGSGESKEFAIKPRPSERALPYESINKEPDESNNKKPVSSKRKSVSASPSVQSVGVRSRETNTNVIVSRPTNAKRSNVRVQQGMDLNELANSRDLQALIDLARNELNADPSNASKQLRLSLLQLADNQPTAAAQLSPALNSRERDLIAQFVASIGQVGSQLSDPMLNTDKVLASIEDLRTSMRSTAALSIPTVALCSRVQTFGIYDELPDKALQGNRINRAIVYCEVDHFASTFDDTKDQYLTELSLRLEVFTADGKSVWSQTEEKINDYSRQRRSDFFLAQLVTLPNTVTRGEYVLKVAITDLLASKTTEAVHRFTVQ